MDGLVKNYNEQHCINKDCTIKLAIQKSSIVDNQLLIIVNDKEDVVGVITDKELRSAILSGIDLNAEVSTIANVDFKSVNFGTSFEDIAALFNAFPCINQIPILKKGRLSSIISVDDPTVSALISRKRPPINADVVIMAGGYGSRLNPFTSIFPKALLPIADETILEKIIKQFSVFNVGDFYISINYKSSLIKAYLSESDLQCGVSFIEESTPMGTIGALSLAKNEFKENIFVTNCDTLVYGDYLKMYDFHESNDFDITIIGAYKDETMPYGVCKFSKGGILEEFIERPSHEVIINTGMYIIKSKMLEYIPENEKFDATDLISAAMRHGKKVGVFPIVKNRWLDAGEWNKYYDTLEREQCLKVL